MPKIDDAFRKDHHELIKKKFKEEIETEKFSGNQNQYMAQKNLSEEEKFKRYVDEHKLPSDSKNSREYVEKITQNDEIQTYSKTIMACVDSIREPMDKDRRKWIANNIVTELNSMKNDKVKNRWIK